MIALLLAVAAHAGDTHLDLGLQTRVPTDAGLWFGAELPSRVRLGATVGMMPPPYLDLVNAVAVGAGWYDESTAELLDAALRNALVVRATLGIRPWARAGWTADAGYAVALLGGGVAAEDAVADATGEDGAALEVGAGVHLLTVDVGHDWVLADRVVVGATVGGAFTVAARAEAHVEGAIRRGPTAVTSPAERATEVLVEETLRRYVHTPTVGVHVGYRFK